MFLLKTQTKLQKYCKYKAHSFRDAQIAGYARHRSMTKFPSRGSSNPVPIIANHTRNYGNENSHLQQQTLAYRRLLKVMFSRGSLSKASSLHGVWTVGCTTHTRMRFSRSNGLVYLPENTFHETNRWVSSPNYSSIRKATTNEHAKTKKCIVTKTYGTRLFQNSVHTTRVYFSV